MSEFNQSLIPEKDLLEWENSFSKTAVSEVLLFKV